MNIDNWHYYYKIDPIDKTKCSTNMLYTPYVNDDNTILCMAWDHTDPYQEGTTRPLYTKELVDFFFNRELEYLEKVKDYNWAPEVLEIDRKNNRIFFKWYKQTCNTIIYTGNNLVSICPDWEQQLSDLIIDLLNAGIYKMSLYPHCMYVDEFGKLHTFDFYACVDKDSAYIEKNLIEGIIGSQSVGRFAETQTGNLIDFKKFFKNTFRYIEWPNDFLRRFYDNNEQRFLE